MSRNYVYASELEIPTKCPFCQSTRFKVYGAKKLRYVEIVEWDSEKEMHITKDLEYGDAEYDIVYSMECASCGLELDIQ